jgi:hypothetical protein
MAEEAGACDAEKSDQAGGISRDGRGGAIHVIEGGGKRAGKFLDFDFSNPLPLGVRTCKICFDRRMG